MIYITFLCLFISIILSFLYSPKAEGFIGESSRIVFFHVPMAWIATLSFFLAAYNSFMYLKKRDYLYDAKAKVLISEGLLFSFLATVTGAIFAKIMWGAWWNWDPRQISITILLLIYAAYLVLRSAIENPSTKAKLSSIYAIFSFFTVPFLVFVIPRVYFSLHPDTFINVRGKIEMHGKILLTFLFSLFSFTLLFFEIYKIDWKTEYKKIKKELANE